MYNGVAEGEEIDQEQQLIVAPVPRTVKPVMSPKLSDDCTNPCPQPGCLNTCNKVKGHHGACNCGKH
jgi:hypothetical protein